MNKSIDVNEMGLCQMLRAIEEGGCTTEALIHACFDRIEAREPEVGAWQKKRTRDEYLAYYQADKAFFDASLLKGLPLGVKDIIDTEEMPTEMGSSIHAGRQPVEDATCVALIRAAGGIVLGKTVTTEFAYFKPGKTKNPADLERTPGGSSSGSAAAIADNMVPMALGSQTAASVIRPAAYCGAIGYVGSRGEFSLRGGQPLAQSLDSLGLFARNVEDIQLLRAILLRQPASIKASESIAPKCVLVCHGESVGETSPAMESATQKAVDKLKAQGVKVVELDAGNRIKDMVNHHINIMAWEVCRNLVIESFQPNQLSDPLATLMEQGLTMDRSSYVASLEAVKACRDWLWRYVPKADAILAPAAPDIAPLGHAATGAPHMSRPWQAMGLPVINVSGMKDENGIPLGLQLIGRVREDDGLLSLASWFKELLN
ncbi:Glutamyl-tRNA(Gln) amidotransferase subunit A [Marinomonas spartinae]|uniref:amidase n=1 Tax=Marinomonas spartinae TaxID=1792290 RepID=UPI000808DF91|nr:amidase [Marinomonas spartinae]SBS36526.1 Glutamyl-tRNA(Gln) amidotransferase subunit A [Marinomonas spartinae]